VRAGSLRRQLGIVPQDGFLFSGTVFENLAFGRAGVGREEAEAALVALGGEGLLRKLPGGLEAQIGERGVRLSAGERQLLAFARALLANPRILILDEATSSLDPFSERRLQAGLARLVAGRTAFVIAHRLSTIEAADLIVVLEGGRIVEAGSHGKLLAAGGSYARMHADWEGAGEADKAALALPSGR